MEKDRIVWPDLVKGMAMLLIIITHSGGARIEGLNETIRPIFDAADKSVQGFIVISVILSLKSYNKSHSKGVATSKWQLDHIIKLLPMYYLALIATYIVRGPNSMWLAPDTTMGLANWLSHILLINFWVPNYCHSLGFEWFIGPIVIIYATIPVLNWLAKSIKRSMVILLFDILFGGFFSKWLGAALSTKYPETLAETYSGYFFFTAHISCIVCGIILYILICRCKIRIEDTRKRYLTSIGLSISSVTLFWIAIYNDKEMLAVNNNVICAFAWSLLVLLLVLSRYGGKGTTWIRYIGKNSLVFYLFNYVYITVINAVYGRICNYKFVPLVEWLLKYLMIIVALSICAPLLSKYYDIPIRKSVLGKIVK